MVRARRARASRARRSNPSRSPAAGGALLSVAGAAPARPGPHDRPPGRTEPGAAHIAPGRSTGSPTRSSSAPAALADLVLLGIPTRGVPLARRLAAVDGFSGRPARSGRHLDITLYRDDLRRRPPRALEETVLPARASTARMVVLVDDVLYSGRTVRAALDALRDQGRPAVVQLAVLVDRGHRRAADPGRLRRQEHSDGPHRRRGRALAEIDGVDGVELRGGHS